MKQNSKYVFGCLIIAIVLAVILLLCMIPVVRVLSRLRPNDSMNLRSCFQSGKAWCSDDGLIFFEIDEYTSGIGTYQIVTGEVEVWVETDMSGSIVEIYIPSYTESGDPLASNELRLEKWSYHSKGEDWFTVKVIESSHYEEGSMITFHLQ